MSEHEPRFLCQSTADEFARSQGFLRKRRVLKKIGMLEIVDALKQGPRLEAHVVTRLREQIDDAQTEARRAKFDQYIAEQELVTANRQIERLSNDIANLKGRIAQAASPIQAPLPTPAPPQPPVARPWPRKRPLHLSPAALAVFDRELPDPIGAAEERRIADDELNRQETI